MALVLSSLRENQSDPTANQRNIVLWSRIDQKSCFKAVLSAGFQCIVVPTTMDGDEVITDLMAMNEMMEQYRGQVLAVISTTSCFAPRVPDQIDEIGKLCASATDDDGSGGVAHVINNAYGLQCSTTVKLLNRACVVGRVDAIICSTDKNFLVPVGGAIITSPKKDVIQKVSKVYAGRASSAPILDLFITLLSMGLDGYKRLLDDRRLLMVDFKSRFEEMALKYSERALVCPNNTISYGITLDTLSQPLEGGSAESINKAEMTSMFGSMLFTRCISGTRVVSRAQSKIIAGQTFNGFGSSTEGFPHSYLTAACAIGLTRAEMDQFFCRLDKCFKDFWKKRSKKKASDAKKSRG